ncbi:MAG: hypothetical protein BV456_13210 [Thermoplasmata archaeon M8B2D]|nr:MAG: hypothetical protein BV456_13210 [Thermoplasmata archaeon M8B2D]
MDSETCDQHHRNKTARKQPAAIDMLKKKIVSTTTPFLPRKKAHQEMSRFYERFGAHPASKGAGFRHDY